MGLLMFNGVPYSGFTEPSSIYTTEEREVGVWIDGKPVYERVFDLGADTAISYTSWTEIDANYPTNCQLLIHVDALTSGGTYASGISVGRKANGKFEMQSGRNGYDQAVRYFTIQYTKTTDVPGSGKYAPDGSVMHHYSTDEHVIGTWINGKTLYEKTIYYTSSVGQSDSDKIIDNTILHGVNCNVVDVQGTQSYGYMSDQMPNNTSDPEPLSQSSLYLPYYGGGNIASAHIYFYSDGIHFMKRCAASEANSIILTIKYVKKSS